MHQCLALSHSGISWKVVYVSWHPGDQYESGILFGRTIFFYFVTSTFQYYLNCAYFTKYQYLCFNTKETIHCTVRIFQCCESYFHTPKSRWGFSLGLNYTSGCKTSNEWPIIIFFHKHNPFIWIQVSHDQLTTSRYHSYVSQQQLLHDQKS